MLQNGAPFRPTLCDAPWAQQCGTKPPRRPGDISASTRISEETGKTALTFWHTKEMKCTLQHAADKVSVQNGSSSAANEGEVSVLVSGSRGMPEWFRNQKASATACCLWHEGELQPSSPQSTTPFGVTSLWA